MQKGLDYMFVNNSVCNAKYFLLGSKGSAQLEMARERKNGQNKQETLY